jgi:hypothetical protein
VKDAGQKDLLYRHFRAQGWFPVVEVAVAPRGGVADKEKLITDIDVFALRPTADLTWEGVVGDCKPKRNESASSRALWVRGLMQYVNATRGYMLLKRETVRRAADLAVDRQDARSSNPMSLRRNRLFKSLSFGPDH